MRVAEVEAAAFDDRINHMRGRQECGDGVVAAAESLCECNQVGLCTRPVVRGQEFSSAPGAAHDFVIDQQHTVFGADLADALVVPGY